MSPLFRGWLKKRSCNLNWSRYFSGLTLDVDVGWGDVVWTIFGVFTAVGSCVVGTQVCDCQSAAVRVRVMPGLTGLHLDPLWWGRAMGVTEGPVQPAVTSDRRKRANGEDKPISLKRSAADGETEHRNLSVNLRRHWALARSGSGCLSLRDFWTWCTLKVCLELILSHTINWTFTWEHVSVDWCAQLTHSFCTASIWKRSLKGIPEEHQTFLADCCLCLYKFGSGNLQLTRKADSTVWPRRLRIWPCREALH